MALPMRYDEPDVPLNFTFLQAWLMLPFVLVALGILWIIDNVPNAEGGPWRHRRGRGK